MSSVAPAVPIKGRPPVILAYHNISPSGVPRRDLQRDTVSVVDFERQLRLLKERRFNLVTLTGLLNLIEGQREIPPRTIAITFDDGYRSTSDYAQPLLERYGFPATVFLATDFIDGDRPFPWLRATGREDLLPMSWLEVQGLVSGGIEMGSHTARHAFLPVMTEIEIQRELTDSRTTLTAMTGNERPALSLPYSYPLDHSRWPSFRTRLVVAMRNSGYSCCCTLSRARMSHIGGTVFLPRVSIMKKDQLALFFVKALGLYSHTAFFQDMYQRTIKRYA